MAGGWSYSIHSSVEFGFKFDRVYTSYCDVPAAGLLLPATQQGAGLPVQGGGEQVISGPQAEGVHHTSWTGGESDHARVPMCVVCDTVCVCGCVGCSNVAIPTDMHQRLCSVKGRPGSGGTWGPHTVQQLGSTDSYLCFFREGAGNILRGVPDLRKLGLINLKP